MKTDAPAVCPPPWWAAPDDDAFGEKAAGLLRLRRLSAGLFCVPRFRVMAPDPLRRYHDRFGPVPRVAVEPIPDMSATPPAVTSFFARFPRFAAHDIAAASFETLRGPWVIRTSLLRGPSAGGSQCGINCTGLASRPEDLAVALPSLLAGLYRPYTDWCLRDRNGDRRRLASLVFMEAVPFDRLGALYIDGEDVHVEVESRGPRPAIERLIGASGRRTRSRLLEPATLAALIDAARRLTAAMSPPGPLEVEFLLDGAGGLFVIQARTLAPSTGVFHSRGDVEGWVVDLRGRPRSHEAAAAVASALSASVGGGDRPVIVVGARDRREFDAFALAWQLVRGPLRGLPPPGALLLVHPEASPFSSTGGFRNHLARALREMLPSTVVGQVEASWASGAARLHVVSDGARLTLTARR
ncbi:MAG TPA: hypothetical protein VG795_14925 [Acidimicrobiia bacterium]|nr:hypothetical protein [Acidimicrobiia bacterium]